MSDIRHDKLYGVDIHVPFAFPYADSSARLAATGFVAEDIGKLARQSDDGSFWQLMNHSPITWKALNTEVSSSIVQSTYINVNQNDQKTITHAEDALGKRMIQVLEYVPGSQGFTNTTLDFDLVDESQFIQEDAANGTDFICGKVQLKDKTTLGTKTALDQTTATGIIGTHIFFTNNGRTVRSDNYYGVAGDVNTHMAPNTGKYFWEVKLDNQSNGSDFFGIAPAANSLYTQAYYTTNFIGVHLAGGGANEHRIYTQNNNTYNIPTDANSAPDTSGGEVIGILVDMDLLKIYFWQDGIFLGSWGIPSTTYRPVISLDGTDQTVTVALNYSDISCFIPTLASDAKIGFDDLGRSYPTTSYYVTTSDQNQIYLANITKINSCTISKSIPMGTSLGVLISTDGRSTWKYWNGATWQSHPGLSTKTGWNTPEEIETGLTNLTITSETFLDFAFLLGTTSITSTPFVDLITLNYDETGVYKQAAIGVAYDVENISATQTRINKLSTGTVESLKINILI